MGEGGAVNRERTGAGGEASGRARPTPGPAPPTGQGGAWGGAQPRARAGGTARALPEPLVPPTPAHKRQPRLNPSGGNVGLMGAVASAAAAAGGSVIGVIPEALQPREARGCWCVGGQGWWLAARVAGGSAGGSQRPSPPAAPPRRDAAIPFSLQISGTTVGELRVVPDMHTRKARKGSPPRLPRLPFPSGPPPPLPSLWSPHTPLNSPHSPPFPRG